MSAAQARAAFRLEIVDQGWIKEGGSDLCSHGSIRALIGGTVVSITEPRQVPEDELEIHRRFWSEFDNRLEQASLARGA